MKRKFREMTGYLSSALAAFVADYALFTLLVIVLSLPVLPSQICARLAGGAVSYLINFYYSFKNRGRFRVAGQRFIILYVISYGASLGLLSISLVFFKLPVFTSKIFSDGLVFGFNFLMMKYFVYNSNIRFHVGGSRNLAHLNPNTTND